MSCTPWPQTSRTIWLAKHLARLDSSIDGKPCSAFGAARRGSRWPAR
ncbi:hypothetical protein QT386_15005 [Solimonas sp. SE-A11]|nr:hypothetical protein [Solimonas sp. SE-A11]